MTFEPTPQYRFTLGEISLAFTSFAVLLGAALLAGEPATDPGLSRAVYTIWVTIALVTPALCAFALPGSSERLVSVWISFWTLSFVAYMVHVGYAVLSVYHGSLQEFLAGQGAFPAIINVLFTLWWALDVGLAWLYRGNSAWVRGERIAAHIFIGLTFFVSTVFLKHGFVNVLGVAATMAVLICLMARYDARKRATPQTRSAAPGVLTGGTPMPNDMATRG